MSLNKNKLDNNSDGFDLELVQLLDELLDLRQRVLTGARNRLQRRDDIHPVVGPDDIAGARAARHRRVQHPHRVGEGHRRVVVAREPPAAASPDRGPGPRPGELPRDDEGGPGAAAGDREGPDGGPPRRHPPARRDGRDRGRAVGRRGGARGQPHRLA